MSTLAERVKLARDRLNLSQQDVADATGMSQPSYYKIEKGLTKRTTYISELAKVLEVNIDWLANGIGEMLDQGAIGSVTKSSLSNEKDRDYSKDAKNSDHIIIGGRTDYGLVDIKYLDIKANMSAPLALKAERLTKGEIKAVDLCPALAALETTE